ncbi:MAG: hypothetical protein A2600_10640 [Candidatus Lambdaproteobacteria bacterium RIFOXYD1_FULL_56_27]|uniref:Uncharacterized protein n=1 Tax=Candidatus Lambdaproteobacteria bacterium RIFOXYD2_FULL_56_26 TaxID=1817773 RepID=A0A1F6GZ74_9PROT|nr:MAG: hypothetical protein A2426_01085 [Candidatus Lambdaproteobacteria bacterium RIFOXYC1_FULL_56_13]OGH03448.1 MAG: hypothetical protein A2557_01700 [Candidatus Lambdaproteobacteria bacterium RIFOXYD2_FULL_56_26]OGH08233.1 MAG: hypothetical protein A2600_10640 [Candidatus Lambdaproteobacteria bacterium RIFOXYD1_FULL_56_27]
MIQQYLFCSALTPGGQLTGSSLASGSAWTCHWIGGSALGPLLKMARPKRRKRAESVETPQ